LLSIDQPMQCPHNAIDGCERKGGEGGVPETAGEDIRRGTVEEEENTFLFVFYFKLQTKLNTEKKRKIKSARLHPPPATTGRWAPKCDLLLAGLSLQFSCDLLVWGIISGEGINPCSVNILHTSPRFWVNYADVRKSGKQREPSFQF
jgi:hypothetical protein